MHYTAFQKFCLLDLVVLKNHSCKTKCYFVKYSDVGKMVSYLMILPILFVLFVYSHTQDMLKVIHKGFGMNYSALIFYNIFSLNISSIYIWSWNWLFWRHFINMVFWCHFWISP